jgi:predicted dienelactone hydrolase
VGTEVSSLEGYAPLYEFWAAHGFVVLQSTHLHSVFLRLQAPADQELFWQVRAEDIVCILDNLDAIEAAVRALKGRLDRTRVAVAGPLARRLDDKHAPRHEQHRSARRGA